MNYHVRITENLAVRKITIEYPSEHTGKIYDALAVTEFEGIRYTYAGPKIIRPGKADPGMRVLTIEAPEEQAEAVLDLLFRLGGWWREEATR